MTLSIHPSSLYTYVHNVCTGTLMLSNSRKKALVDASYNRYAWGDSPDDLPAWFLEDEMRHNKPIVPVPAALLDQVCVCVVCVLCVCVCVCERCVLELYILYHLLYMYIVSNNVTMFTHISDQRTVQADGYQGNQESSRGAYA